MRSFHRIIALLLTPLCLFFAAHAEGGTASAKDFEDVLPIDDEEMFFGKKYGTWHLYSGDGEQLLDFPYVWLDEDIRSLDPIPFFNDDGIARILFGSGSYSRYGYIDREGTFLVEPEYINADLAFAGELTVVQRPDRQWGIIDKSGDWIMDMDTYLDLEWDADDDTYRLSFHDGERYYKFTDGKLEEIVAVSAEIDLEPYRAHVSRVPRLDFPASLQLEEPLPRLDGAKAVFPLYSGVVEAVYPESVQYEDIYYDYAPGDEQKRATPVYTYTNTPGAYQRLIDGETDLIFVAQPSDQQLADAEAAGVEFELTTIAKEAFVFFVQEGNPIRELTVEQIRDIYSGKITDWEDLGAPGLGRIVAYQRNEGSGSQTALQKLMGDAPLMDPPTSELFTGMETIVEAAEYKNLPNAIGFSFRFFVTGMMNSGVRLLALDGVEPTEEAIASGEYPIIADVYAVSRKGEKNPNVSLLVEWLLSDEGQELVRRSGYVSVAD